MRAGDERRRRTPIATTSPRRRASPATSRSCCNAGVNSVEVSARDYAASTRVAAAHGPRRREPQRLDVEFRGPRHPAPGASITRQHDPRTPDRERVGMDSSRCHGDDSLRPLM